MNDTSSATLPPPPPPNCTSLSFLFAAASTPTSVVDGNLWALAVQSTPTASTILCCIFVEWMAWTRRAIGRTTVSRARRNVVLLVALVAVGAQAVMLWRTAAMLDCEGHVSLLHDTQFLPSIVAIGTAAFDLFFVCVVVHRFPRTAVVTFLCMAAASVAVDWILRGGVLLSEASQLLVAVQQTFDILAVACLHFIPAYTMVVHKCANRARAPRLRPSKSLVATMRPSAPKRVVHTPPTTLAALSPPQSSTSTLTSTATPTSTSSRRPPRPPASTRIDVLDSLAQRAVGSAEAGYAASHWSWMQ